MAPKAPKILEASMAPKASATTEPAASGHGSVRRGVAHYTGKHFGGRGNKTDIHKRMCVRGAHVCTRTITCPHVCGRVCV